MLQKITLTWQSFSTAYRLYTIAALLLGVSVISMLISKRVNAFSNAILAISYLLFALGFVFWIKPWLKEKWQSTLGKWSLGVLHAVILFFAVIPSRNLVGMVLGLPPQDFDMTVSIFTLVLYPMLWVLLLSIATSLFAFAIFSLAAICNFSIYPLFNETLLLTSKLLSKPSRVRSFIENERKSFVSKSFGHAMGALVVSIVAAALWDTNVKFVLRNPLIITWVAYYTDFQVAYRYPGIDHSKRIRLHENGVVSYAEKDGWNINITVGKVGE